MIQTQPIETPDLAPHLPEPIIVNTPCKHPAYAGRNGGHSTWSVRLELANRHVDMNTYTNPFQGGGRTSISLFDLDRQTTIDFAHRLLETAFSMTDDAPHAGEEDEERCAT